jgi:hypothetical protein
MEDYKQGFLTLSFIFERNVLKELQKFQQKQNWKLMRKLILAHSSLT